MDYFSQHIFSDPPKKNLDYSLWFLQNFAETMTAGYFLGGGGEGGNLPPLDCCLPPLQIGSNNSVLYFPKIIHPQDPPTTGRTPISPPFKISLENTLHTCTYIHVYIYTCMLPPEAAPTVQLYMYISKSTCTCTCTVHVPPPPPPLPSPPPLTLLTSACSWRMQKGNSCGSSGNSGGETYSRERGRGGGGGGGGERAKQTVITKTLCTSMLVVYGMYPNVLQRHG